jgi:hypothetical protein
MREDLKSVRAHDCRERVRRVGLDVDLMKQSMLAIAAMVG